MAYFPWLTFLRRSLNNLSTSTNMPELDDLRSPSVVQLTSSDLSAADLIPVYHAASNTVRRIPAQDLGDPVDNATVVGAIETDPAAIIAALSDVEDYADPELVLTAADNGKIYRCTNGADIVVTTPEDDPGGPFSVAFIQGHAGGAVVFNAAAGTTLQSYNDLNATAGIHAWASIIRVAANTYNLSGTLA